MVLRDKHRHTCMPVARRTGPTRCHEGVSYRRSLPSFVMVCDVPMSPFGAVMKNRTESDVRGCAVLIGDGHPQAARSPRGPTRSCLGTTLQLEATPTPARRRGPTRVGGGGGRCGCPPWTRPRPSPPNRVYVTVSVRCHRGHTNARATSFGGDVRVTVTSSRRLRPSVVVRATRGLPPPCPAPRGPRPRRDHAQRPRRPSDHGPRARL